MDLLKIENNGQEIISTDYFDSEYAKKGYFYLSINAGAFRLLIPPSWERDIDDMKTGKMAIVSFGMEKGTERIEVMFDDSTECPYCISLGMEQIDRKPPKEESSRIMTLIAYSYDLNKEFEMKCGFRYVPTLPYYKPWTHLYN